MNLSEYSSVSDIIGATISIQDRLWFSNQYRNKVNSEGKQFAILSSGSHAIPVSLYNKYCFHMAEFICEPAKLAETGETETEFLNQVVLYLKHKKKVQSIMPTPAYSMFTSYPTCSKRIKFGNYLVDLTLDEEKLFSNVHSKHRNSIRKAEKDGVTVVFGVTDKLLSEYCDMDDQTWKRGNRASKGIEYYRSKLQIMPNNTVMGIAYYDGIPQSGAFIYYDNVMGYYMFGANVDHPHTGAGNYLQWQMILYLKKLGLQQYSFVGCRINEDENSKYHEIQRFKERFGGDLKIGYMFKVICNPMMNTLFEKAIQLKTKNRPHDVIDDEIHKWSDIN